MKEGRERKAITVSVVSRSIQHRKVPTWRWECVEGRQTTDHPVCTALCWSARVGNTAIDLAGPHCQTTTAIATAIRRGYSSIHDTIAEGTVIAKCIFKLLFVRGWGCHSAGEKTDVQSVAVGGRSDKGWMLGKQDVGLLIFSDRYFIIPISSNQNGVDLSTAWICESVCSLFI